MLPAVVAPLLVCIFFDILCNGQTKYFLSLMKTSGGLGRFVLIAYSNLTVTVSFAIIGASIASIVFAFLSLGVVNKNLILQFDFSRVKDLPMQKPRVSETIGNNDRNEFFLLGTSTVVTDLDLAHNIADCRIMQLNPDEIPGIHMDCYNTTDKHLVQFTNRDSVVVRYISDDRLRPSDILVGVQKLGKDSFIDFCLRVSNAPRDVKFKMLVVDGWDEQEVFQACINKKKVKLTLDLAVKTSSMDIFELASTAMGSLVSHSLASITKGFDRYFSISPTWIMETDSNFRDNYYIGDNKDPEANVQYVLIDLWQMRNGAGRYAERLEYPLSTLYIATLMTSAFIWGVIVLTALVYPAVWLNEKLASEYRAVKIEEYPFTTIAIIISAYVILGTFVINTY